MRLAAEVIIVGAGPAGSACAAELARAGRDVLLIDRCAFPRDKTCGDGLIADAITALGELGVLERVRARALSRKSATVYAAGGTPLTLAGTFLTLSRRQLDALLAEHAVACGARLEEGLRVDDVEPGARGATVRGRRSGRVLERTAPLVVLATGAAGTPPAVYRRAGLQRPRPTAVAARRYLRVDHRMPLAGLTISFDAGLRPGYGWVFPLPEGVVNVGVACFGARPRRQRLPEAWDAFVRRFPVARELQAECVPLDRLQGAPLATGMHRPSRPGRSVVAIGEAAGLTFPASGEGIGKALQSGIALARALAPVAADSAALAAAADNYAARWERDKRELYRGYEAAQRWLTQPLVSELMARCARRRPAVRHDIEGLIAETVEPARLFSLRGLLGALG